MNSTFIGNNQFSGLSVEDRFWQKVDKRSDEDCWNWIGCTHHQWGYGNFSFHRKYMAAHRYSWIIRFGDIPEGMCICHKCDNPRCVNPNHLFLGTVADNNYDKKIKGRQPSVEGENNPNAKLSRDDVIKIRTLYASGKHSGAELARNFGVNPETVYHILNGKRWKNVEVRSED